MPSSNHLILTAIIWELYQLYLVASIAGKAGVGSDIAPRRGDVSLSQVA
jgi:hypothetical protein